jgi:alpha-ribazole phosphatase
MRIDLVRHGECLDEAFLRGQSPSELSPLGEKQMQAVFSSLACSSHQTRPELVVVSPAKRCLNPVRSFYQSKKKCTNIQICPAFQERHFGIWDGLSYEEVKSLYSNELQCYLENPFDYHIEQSESLTSFENRVLPAFEQLLIQASAESVNHILMVTHGGVMRVLLKHILGLQNEALFQLEVDFAARITLESFALNPVDCNLVNATFPKSYFIKFVELVQSSESVLKLRI